MMSGVCSVGGCMLSDKIKMFSVMVSRCFGAIIVLLSAVSLHVISSP